MNEFKAVREPVFQRVVHYAKVLGPLPALASIVGKLSGYPIRMALKRPGIAHPISIRLPSSDMDAYEQIFLHREYDVKLQHTPDVIIDAGANIGLASIYFSGRYPSAKVYAIECENSNFQVLQRNVAPYPNIVPIHAALWDQNGEIRIVDPGLGKWGFMTTAEADPAVWSTPILALTLESIMATHGIERIDILKIDIEGAELEVLKSSSTWIAKVDLIIAELHDHLKAGCEASFLNATSLFPHKWIQGENCFASRSAP